MNWQIDKEHEGLSIRDYLRQEHAFSRRILKAVIYEGGSIKVNGQERTLAYRLMTADNLLVDFPPERIGSHMQPENMNLDILYEDDAVIVLNKPAGRASIPSLHHPTGTIANGLLQYYDETGITSTVHIVTRLDRDTSGLMLIAKNRYSHSILSSSQRAGEVERDYMAIAEGIVHPEFGTIDAPIGRKPDSIIERVVDPDGQPAVTHYQNKRKTATHTLLHIRLETGRTHQIRVHLAHIGYPLAGDDLYGGSLDIIKRHALHCAAIRFIHPFTKEWMSFEAVMPTDMCSMIEP
ncbi:RluA family pseudouridine synthase [Ornithinibacillus gellani]|uniref:RluA family pseudouridine synthase n=1 Tax=Ornithinibacillus gellani TaxID=2293253 RepID=UPI000F47DF7B|nr:RluA family pseudouridine synthase [Ornithinibacillus gellani]TQS75799.1 RluA family pseudouridine synthase [Ornithinibacillus gellani]